MRRYLVLRLGRAAATLLGVTIAVFVLTHVVGDPATIMNDAGASNEAIAATRQSLGLDKPLPEQFGTFVLDGLKGDFGPSFYYRVSSTTLLIRSLGPTLILSIAAMTIVILVGITAGVIGSLRPGSRADRLVSTASIMGIAMPEFWLALLLIMVLGVALKVLPTSGFGSWQNIILPAITLASPSVARVAQLSRSAMVEELRKDYVTVAYSKGLTMRMVVTRHALKNAGLPIITQVGLEAAELFAGRTVIVETIFGWPGVGGLAGNAFFGFDFPLIQTVVLWAAVVTVMVNLVVDLSYAWFDPRIRYA